MAPNEIDPVPIPAAESLIRFDLAEFNPAQATYLRGSNPRLGGRVEIAEFSSPTSRAVIGVLSAPAGWVFEQKSTEAYVRPLFEDTELRWQERGTYREGATAFDYRLFDLPEEDASCVGFDRESNQSLGDDLGRNTAVVYGFYCRAGDDGLSRAEAERLIGRITLAGSR